MADTLKLTQTLVTKLLHDISGSITAIGNGAEFIDNEDPDIRAHALEIIADSSKKLQRTHKFFKTLYSLPPQSAKVSEIPSNIKQYYEDCNVTVSTPEHLKEVIISGQQLQLVLNAFYLVYSSSYNKIELALRRTNDQTLQCEILAHGPSSQNYLEIANSEDIDIHNTQAHVLIQIAKTLGQNIETEATSSYLRLNFEIII